MKFAVVTFGCRVNQADSQRVEDDLRARGATEVHPDIADVLDRKSTRLNSSHT